VEPRSGGKRNLNRRKALIRAALKLFAKRGFYGTTLRSVAREAGVKAFAQVDRASDAEDVLRTIGSHYFTFLHEMRGFYVTWLMCPQYSPR